MKIRELITELMKNSNLDEEVMVSGVPEDDKAPPELYEIDYVFGNFVNITLKEVK